MISSIQHLLPQAGVTADTAPAHKGKERLGTIGKWDMQSTWMVSASLKGEGKNHSPPKQTSVHFVASSFQPAKITADVTGAPRGPWPSLRITEPMTPVGCPEHKHTSSLSQGHGRSSSLRHWTCLPRGLKAWPALPLPSQKVLSSDSLLVQLQSCAGFAARAVGSVLPFLFPRQERWIMWSCLALTPGSGQRKPRQLLPNSWSLLRAAQSLEKRRVTSSKTPGSCLPLRPAAAIPRLSRSQQSSRQILPSPQRQNGPKRT